LQIPHKTDRWYELTPTFNDPISIGIAQTETAVASAKQGLWFKLVSVQDLDDGDGVIEHPRLIRLEAGMLGIQLERLANTTQD
jgi:hypothetical protein